MTEQSIIFSADISKSKLVIKIYVSHRPCEELRGSYIVNIAVETFTFGAITRVFTATDNVAGMVLQLLFQMRDKYFYARRLDLELFR